MLYNPQSINTNVDAVMDYISDNNITILALCETWLSSKNSPTTAKIKARGFEILYYCIHKLYLFNKLK